MGEDCSRGRLELLEFPRYNIFFTQGKTQKPKTRTYYVGHSVPVPDFSKPIRIRSVPAPKILKLIRTRTRTRSKFSKKIRTRHVYAPKNPFFFRTRSFYAPVLGYGCVDVDGFRLRTPGPGAHCQLTSD